VQDVARKWSKFAGSIQQPQAINIIAYFEEINDDVLCTILCLLFCSRYLLFWLNKTSTSFLE